MNENNIYDPEDLEKLLSSKSFSELLPEEKAFVLQYVDNDAEYDAMRSTYTLLGTLPELEPAIEPSSISKEKLMAAFTSANTPEQQENKLLVFWLWFWNTNKAIFLRPAFQLASLGLVITLGYYISVFNLTSEMAEVKTEKVEKNMTQDNGSSDTPKKESDSEPSTITPDIKEIDSEIPNVLEDEEVKPESNEKIELIEEDMLSKKLDIDMDTNSDDELLIVREEMAEEESLDFTAFDESLSETTVTNYSFSATDSAPPVTDITYKTLSGNESIIEFDGRAEHGNALSVTYDLNEIKEVSAAKSSMKYTDDFKSEIASKNELMALNASSFVDLMDKLHTAE